MRLTAPRLASLERTATIFRGLTLALAALAIALSGQPIEPRLVALGVAYAVWSAVLWLLAPHLRSAWVVYPVALADVGAVTALIALSPAAALPLWALYLFPLASAAATGRLAVALAGLVSVLGYLIATWLGTDGVSALALWPVALLAAGAFVAATLAARWVAEQRERRAWQAMVGATRALTASGEPDEVAALVVERARRLMRAERAQLWWCEEADRLRPGPQLGPVSDQPLMPDMLTPGLARRLEQSPIPLAEFGEPFANCVGEAVALRHAGARVAVLVVAWNSSPRDRAARRERLRVLAPWAADALAQARARAAARERLRREHILREAATALAATLDRQVIQGTIVEAARSGLGTAVSLVERPSGRILAGDAELAERLVKLTLDREVVAVGSEAPLRSAGQADGPLVIQVGCGLALLAWRAEAPFDESDAKWCGELARLGGAALERCAAYEELQAQRDRLDASLEVLPAPLALREASGGLVLTNAAYRALDLPDLEPSGPSLAEVGEDELSVGSPPRTFVVVTRPLAEGQYVLRLYREITREREALRAKDELISLVGHELRTPLTSISGYNQIVTRHLGIVQQQVEQLNRLVSDFMDASRSEGAQLPIAREQVDLAEVARAAASRFRGAHERRTLRLDLADVPTIEGDPARLGQVLDNLLGNAAKYSPADTEIVLAVGTNDGQVVVSVRDRGVGIAPEYLPHLFDRLFRAPGADGKQVGGFGLGLSIVRDIVAAHGGRTWAESGGADHGSTFWVALPTDRTGVAEPTPTQ